LDAELFETGEEIVANLDGRHDYGFQEIWNSSAIKGPRCNDSSGLIDRSRWKKGIGDVFDVVVLLL